MLKNNKPHIISINNAITRIKNGDIGLKEELIKKYKPYLLKVISSTVGRYIDSETSEEYSVGLMAFNEAIDKFDSDKNGNFISYCNIVINHRIIDHIRKNKRENKAIPFSYFEEKSEFEERYLVSDSHYQYEKIEIKEEIMIFENKLKEFGITLEDLVKKSPKHKDSRELYINIARIISENEELFNKMIKRKAIPISDLMKFVTVSRKTIERNRKYIIAVSLVLRSGLDEIKQYFRKTKKEGGKVNG
ncbi:RNA polymerase sigma factor SigI [Acetivibrio saccincola]|uniref:RNA polymerase sigma factor SigI n=1 Tax=Acetivibrio saccincola TaxID=1677857 RepID=A0A2K9ER07_9FIRM|nr:RNA polymerase sigma-I factor [Acetivibrio saccincola]AUG57940.1 RNA polymerase sigma factor SigI [Acetivibrio saccincola]